MNVNGIELPKLMEDLPRDNRGLPIPYVVLNDNNGCPHFKVNDTEKSLECIIKKLCNVCGKPLGNDMWMLGGPASAFHPEGVFNDPPVHKECGVYSLKACPYLGKIRYNSKGPDIKDLMHIAQNSKVNAFVNNTQSNVKLPFFVLARTAGYRPNLHPIVITITPVRPFITIEFWKDGAQIPQPPMSEIAKLVFG